MKKLSFSAFSVGASLALAVAAFAGIQDPTIINDASLANAAATTNSMVIRGEVVGIAVRIEDAASAVRTNTVSITSADGQTIFSGAVVGTCTSFYPVAVALVDTAGSTINSSTVAASTNKVYAAQPVASKVTCTVTGSAFPTLTNSVTVKVLVRQ